MIKMSKAARRNYVVTGMIFTGIFIFIVVTVAWGWLRERDFFCPYMRAAHCARNLAAIARAKELLRAEHGLTNGARLAAEQLRELTEGGWKALKCPAGGEYWIHPIGQPPVCSKHGGE
jgi:hypothetical protein